MKINNNITMDMFKIHTSKNPSKEDKKRLYNARKENPSLDRALYQHDLAKIHEEDFKVKSIASKIAKGQKLSEEEKKYIQEKNPELLKKAKEAKNKAKNLKKKLENTNNPMNKQKIIADEFLSLKKLSTYDELGAKLLTEAYNSVIKEHNKEQNNTLKDNKVSSIREKITESVKVQKTNKNIENKIKKYLA